MRFKDEGLAGLDSLCSARWASTCVVMCHINYSFIVYTTLKIKHVKVWVILKKIEESTCVHSVSDF
jgi:hypothetical protein